MSGRPRRALRAACAVLVAFSAPAGLVALGLLGCDSPPRRRFKAVGGVETAPPEVVKAAATKADAPCLDCHIDFKAEPIVAFHQKAGITCERCHGRSRAHMEDEVRATKADVTFKGKQITLFCLTCHEGRRFRKVAIHRREMVKRADQQRPCTACHGEHELLDVELLTPGGS